MSEGQQLAAFVAIAMLGALVLGVVLWVRS